MEILETGYVYGDVLELRRYGRRISFPNTRNVSIFAKAVCFITLSLWGPARARRVLETEQISQHQMIIQLDLCGSFKELGRYLRQDKFVVTSKSLEGTGEGYSFAALEEFRVGGHTAPPRPPLFTKLTGWQPRARAHMVPMHILSTLLQSSQLCERGGAGGKAACPPTRNSSSAAKLYPSPVPSKLFEFTTNLSYLKYLPSSLKLPQRSS